MTAAKVAGWVLFSLGVVIGEAVLWWGCYWLGYDPNVPYNDPSWFWMLALAHIAAMIGGGLWLIDKGRSNP